MTDIDTAAIRASVSGRCDAVAENLVDVCDALDAARAAWSEVKGLLDDKSRRDDTALMAYKREKHRAEAAEARIAAFDRAECEHHGYKALVARVEAAEKEVRRLGLVQIDCVTLRTDLHAAEVRIAAALDLMDQREYARARRALTEGTCR